MWLLLVVLCAYLCLSRENICTEINRFPQVNKNYSVAGQLIETTAVGGLLGCVHECLLKATCEAFTYNKKTRDCSMYDQFEFSSPNNINGNDVLTSIISDWNSEQNYTKGRVNQALTPGQDCFIRATEQLLPNGTVIERRRFYNGTLNITLSGRECQKWISNTPHKHDLYGNVPGHFATGESMEEVANYCRIVLPDPVDIPWCYTKDPGKRWDRCNENHNVWPVGAYICGAIQVNLEISEGSRCRKLDIGAGGTAKLCASVNKIATGGVTMNFQQRGAGAL